jgi:hypothetical protein
VYVGGHFRRERPTTVEKLKASGFTYVILFNVNVEEDGTLTTDGDTICKNGAYVFDGKHPYYASDVASLKQGVTNITRIEMCIGGWGNQSYNRIKTLVAAQGVGRSSMLYKNFSALKAAVPDIDAVNNDDEHAYDVSSATAFHVMMYDIGYLSTFAPYTQKNYWKSLIDNVKAQRPIAAHRVYIQCYDGGAGNNPRDWHLGDLPLHGGRLNYQDFNESITTMTSWKAEQDVSGGFFWVYNDETWDLNKYALAVNRIYHIAENTVATFYTSSGYGGVAVSLPTGEYTKTQLMYYGLPDNSIASFKVSAGYQATVYADDNFSGSEATYTLENPRLGSGIAGRISSLKIEEEGSGLTSRTLSATCTYDVGRKIIAIESQAPDAYRIVSLSGATVGSGMLRAGTNRIDASKFGNGVYFVRLKSQTAAAKLFLY